MTYKQQRFIDEYMLDCNGTQAAIRAGYSPKSARKSSSDLLRVPEIASEIKRRQYELSGKIRITQEKIIEELGRVAFGRRLYNGVKDHDKIRALEILLKHFDNNDDRLDKLDAVLAKIEGNI